MAINFDKGFELHAKGMQLRAQRAEVIASNIANADTPGYKAKGMDFQKAMQQASQQQMGMNKTHAKHFDIRTEINNRGGILKPEMFVQGKLQKKASHKSQLSVPKSAVLWTGVRSVVYVKVPDMDIPSFQFREVELGERLGDSYQVSSGLETGEEVVTYGSFTIDAAAQLNNQVSMMNKDVMKKGADHSMHLPDYTEVTPLEFKQQISSLKLYGRILLAKKEFDEAKVIFEKAIEQKIPLDEVSPFLAEIAFEKRDFNSIPGYLSIYRRFEKSTPAFQPVIHYWLAPKKSKIKS